MRNDFYVGIYEDRYLAHGIKGWIKKGHKYLSRLWKNNRWFYIYEQARNARASAAAKNETQNRATQYYVDAFTGNTAGAYKNYAGALKAAHEAEYRGRKAAEANLAWRKKYITKSGRKKMQYAMNNWLSKNVGTPDGTQENVFTNAKENDIRAEQKRTGKVKRSSYRKFAQQMRKDYKYGKSK